MGRGPFDSCYDRGYFFNYGFNPEHIPNSGSKVIRVEGGVAPYTWEITGTKFTLAEAETDVQYNIVVGDDTVDAGDSETLTVTDACGTEVSGDIIGCEPAEITTCCDDAGYDLSMVYSPLYVAKGITTKVVVSGGCPVYLWEISGTGFTLKDEYTNEAFNYIIAEPDAEGPVVLTVTDVCETEITASVYGVNTGGNEDNTGTEYSPGCKEQYVILTADTESSDSTVTKGDSATLYVTGGLGPYVWTTPDNIWFDEEFSENEKTTSDLNVTIYADYEATDDVTVTVVDSCGLSAEFELEVLDPSTEVFVAVGVKYGGATDLAMTSVAGTEWIQQSTPSGGSWTDVCWSPQLKLFCAVGYYASNYVMTSPDGAVWTARTAPASTWRGVCWSPDLELFCAVGRNTDISAGTVMTSPDGITWTSQTCSYYSRWYDVCWSPELGKFCAVASLGATQRIMISSDGASWTGYAPPVYNSWNSVCWSPELELFCAVSDSGSSNKVITSPDGVVWTPRTTNNDFWFGVCWSPELELFCAVAYYGTGGQVMTSPNGVTWTPRNAVNDNYWYDVCWSTERSIFCAVAMTPESEGVMISEDGTTWAAQEAAENEEWVAVCWSSSE